MNKNINKFDRFRYYSTQAAKNERQGNWQYAAEQWNIAELNAPNPQNKQWCIKRAEFCKRIFRKPF